MATRPKSVIESHDGKKFSPITIAKNVLTDDGQNLHDILSDRKEDMMTPTIENSSSMSKVGQGDNVDFSDNVMNGAYESCVLKGRSLVNGLSNPEIRQGGGYITMVSPTHLIINHGENLTENKINVNYDWFGGKMEDEADYTLDVWILKNTMHRKTDPNANIGKINFNNYNTGFYAIPSNTLGHITYEVTTPKTNTGGKPYIETFTTCEGELEIQMVVRQGKNLAPIEQHFEGLCDVKSPILSNVGKNLFDNVFTVGGWWNGVANNNPDLMRSVNLTPVKPNTTYIYNSNIEGHRQKANFMAHASDGSFIEYLGFGRTFTTPSNCHYIHLYTENDNSLIAQIEEGTVSTTIEPYKSNILSFDQKDGKTIVLRSLPNGVYDTLNVETGEYTQRIGEIVLDGSDDEGWTYNSGGSIHGKRCFVIPRERTPYRKQYGYTICDKMPVTTTLDKVGVYNGQGLNILIDSNSSNVNVLKEILASNPTTVQYELETPTIKQVNVEGYPYSYENGHVLLESGSIEQSLTPTVEYSIVANRGGQIRSNQKMVERQQKELDRLQTMVLVNLVNTRYEQTLTNLKYDLKNVREEVK